MELLFWICVCVCVCVCVYTYVYTHICIYGHRSTRWQWKCISLLGLCLKSLKAIGLGYREQSTLQTHSPCIQETEPRSNSATMMRLRRIQIQIENVPSSPNTRLRFHWQCVQPREEHPQRCIWVPSKSLLSLSFQSPFSWFCSQTKWGMQKIPTWVVEFLEGKC